MARKVSVPGSVVRAWLREQGEQVGDRGRLSAAQVKAFQDATGKRYVTGHVAPVQVKGIRETANGRKVPVSMNVSPSELRAFALANGGGARGRIPADIRAAFAARGR